MLVMIMMMMWVIILFIMHSSQIIVSCSIRHPYSSNRAYSILQGRQSAALVLMHGLGDSGEGNVVMYV